MTVIHNGERPELVDDVRERLVRIVNYCVEKTPEITERSCSHVAPVVWRFNILSVAFDELDTAITVIEEDHAQSAAMVRDKRAQLLGQILAGISQVEMLAAMQYAGVPIQVLTQKQARKLHGKH